MSFFTAHQAKSNYACEKEWARHFARVYYHEVDKTPGFLTIYTQLLSSVERVQKRPVTRSSAKPVFAAPNEQTDAERRRGKYEFNRILHKEYNEWYDAFMEEDNKDGWLHHAAQRLSRKTGVSAEAIRPVVEAWLLEKS